jgi:hypothetical protein
MLWLAGLGKLVLLSNAILRPFCPTLRHQWKRSIAQVVYASLKTGARHDLDNLGLWWRSVYSDPNAARMIL